MIGFLDDGFLGEFHGTGNCLGMVELFERLLIRRLTALQV